MTQGFVTLAVGDEKYFKLAVNLLTSYKFHTKQPYKFAIVSDRTNKYTELFDDVVLITEPQKSYMDKIKLLELAPYDQNIFIDADCLAYGDLNDYWTYFPSNGTSCFGKALPLTSKEGWFLIDDIGEYKNDIDFIPQMHGGIIFINKDSLTRKIYETCLVIAKEYSKYKFKYFVKPADEPIMALSMAINKSKPIELVQTIQDKMFLFYPIAKKVMENMQKGICSYTMDGIIWIDHVKLLHWQNCFTNTPKYKCSVASMKYQTETFGTFKLLFLKFYYHISFCINNKCFYYLRRVLSNW